MHAYRCPVSSVPNGIVFYDTDDVQRGICIRRICHRLGNDTSYLLHRFDKVRIVKVAEQLADQRQVLAGNFLPQPRRSARHWQRPWQRDAGHARMAGSAPTVDRAGSGKAPSPWRRSDPLRCVFQLPGGALPPSGRFRSQPRRQVRQAAGCLRSSVQRRGLPGCRGGVCRQYRRSSPPARWRW